MKAVTHCIFSYLRKLRGSGRHCWKQPDTLFAPSMLPAVKASECEIKSRMDWQPKPHKRVPTSSKDEHPVSFALERPNVLCLKSFGTFRDIELYTLAFLQAAEAAALNGRKMHENVFAILTADKAVAFGVVKPLHCSCFH